MRTPSLVLHVLIALSLCACAGDDAERRVYEVRISEGRYLIDGGAGVADVDPAGRRVVFTLADGSQHTATLTPRARSGWRGDCASMTSYVLEEVADLSPAPLRLGAVHLAAPVLFPKCGPSRLLVADGDGYDGEGRAVILDRP